MREAAGGRHPVIAAARDQQVENLAMWQAIRDGVVYEFVTIETRQTIVSAEPQKPARIGNDLVNTVTRQAISGVGAKWEVVQRRPARTK